MFEASTSLNVLVVMVLAFIASLNVAVTVVPVLTPVVPAAGLTDVTEGVTDDVEVKTMSIQ